MKTIRQPLQRRQAREALLHHTERQLEELYGPLAFLLAEGTENWRLLELAPAIRGRG